MIYLWDVKNKNFNWKHVRWGITLCQATLTSFGLGFDFHYSNSPVTNRDKRGGWLSLKLLWIDLLLYADWGNKARTDKQWKRFLESV